MYFSNYKDHPDFNEMLYKETVSPTTWELLVKLMGDQILKDFFLVGGTALSLQIGHRISIDLDLFRGYRFQCTHPNGE